MSKETDKFKAYLNSIMGQIPDDIHNELWNRLIEVIVEMNAPPESTKTRKQWVCNSCNTSNFTDSVPEEEIEMEMHSCINCGGFEFHLEPYAQATKFEHPPVYSENGERLFFNKDGYMIRPTPVEDENWMGKLGKEAAKSLPLKVYIKPDLPLRQQAVDNESASKAYAVLKSELKPTDGESIQKIIYVLELHGMSECAKWMNGLLKKEDAK